MKAGPLNRQVLIQYLAAGQDEIGQPLQTWTNLITVGDGKVWANIKLLSGVESIKAGAELSVVKASIRIRYRTDVTAGMRVVHGTKVYDIKAVLPDETVRDRLDLTCEVDGG